MRPRLLAIFLLASAHLSPQAWPASPSSIAAPVPSYSSRSPHSSRSSQPATRADPASTPTPADWPVYHGDAAGTHYSALRQINRRNVHRLEPAWVYRCTDARERPATTIECNPLAIGGTLYLTTPGLKVVALDATRGHERWVFDPWEGRSAGGVNRGLATWTDDHERRLFFAAGPWLYALDAATGRPIPEFGNSGRIDLRAGLDQDAFYLSVNAPTPGVVWNDLLILGSAIPDTLPPTAPGHVRAFDVRTGQRRWIFHTLPHPGELGAETWSADAWRINGGANAWGGVTLDREAGVVFAGTGSANYDHFGGDRPGLNLFANCVLALDAATGARRWHFQTTHHDLWDYDLPCAPVLLDVRHRGRRIPAVAQITKTGFVFVLDRATGQPLFPVEERPVPGSNIPGEQAWPTQPFPTRPPAFARQGFGPDEVTDLNAAARDAVSRRLATMRHEGLYTPPSREPTAMLPQFNGGGEWGGPAVDPRRGWLFVNASNEAEWIQMQPARPTSAVTLHELGGHLFRIVCVNCHGAGRADLPALPALQSLETVAQRLTRSNVLAVLETGRGQMPSFAALSAIERRSLVAFLFDDRGGEPLTGKDLDLTWANRIPWVGGGHLEFRDAEGFPANRRPWGTLTALDLNRGTIAWQVPLGTYPALERRGLPPTGTFNIGGPLVTAGDVLFIGATMDERFRAFDTRNGKVLWEYQLDAGGYATPATYEVDGRQYVIIAGGGGGKPETKAGNGWWCFSLPERHAKPSGETGHPKRVEAINPTPKRAVNTTASKPPNFLVILADDLGFSDLGCYGGEIRTPNLDALARGGLRFTQFYNTARCWPTRSALMTGYYPQEVRMDPPKGRLPTWALTLPQRLKPWGYRCYQSGKWHVPGAPRVNADAGFDHSYVLEDHDRNFYPRRLVEDDVVLPPVATNAGYYTSTAFADHLIQSLREHATNHAAEPFFAFLAFTVPHFPLQAPAEEIERYRNAYLAGWDVIRERRAKRVRQLGVLPRVALSPREAEAVPYWNLPEADLQNRIGNGEIGRAVAWTDLTPEQRQFQATKMAIHAAMIDRMDQEIGRVLEQLRTMGTFEDTVVLFASDNGASAEQILRGDGHDPTAAPGSAGSFLCLGPGWSSAANAPFRLHKSWVHEGGIATPLIVHWPRGVADHGAFRRQAGHIIDLVPTLIELARNGRSESAPPNGAPPLPGRSLASVFTRDGPWPDRTLYFHHDANRALRVGDWKLVAGRPGTNTWTLFDLRRDRTEQHDLAGRQPNRVQAMATEWEALERRFRAEAAEVTAGDAAR